MKKSEQTRIAILEAGIDCLRDGGFHGLTLTRIAETAGVTRGCLRYYFASLEDFTAALAEHVTYAKWRVHADQIENRPPGVDALAYAVSLVGDRERDRLRVARMELVVASRTLPALRAAIERTSEQVDAEMSQLLDRLFDRPGVASQAHFQAARDLAALVDDWLFLQCLPAPADARREGIRRALAHSLFNIWRGEPGALDPDRPKPRIRVPASEAVVA